MKKLLFLFLLVCCCACDEDKTVDPTLMPEATTTGANTLGCLIDGWVYASGRYGTPSVRLTMKRIIMLRLMPQSVSSVVCIWYL